VIAKAPERVLSTLDADGHRIRLSPRPSKGRFWRRRAVVAYGLIALFALLPFVRIGGRPALLIDLERFELLCFGAIFRPSEGAVLMLVGLTIVIAVFLVTALWGRVWCGWACPQTVYMEWVFRPIERLTKHRPVLRHTIYAVLSVAVANVFLAYFVGVSRLGEWIAGSPSQHPGGFLVMASVGALMFADFAWFREQTCIVACPYGRLQSVLLDRQSLIVGYDARRGEPRGKIAKKKLPVLQALPTGDCVDCRACVTTCPTGIDIRQGLQMECIGCAQCIDACDAIMSKVGRAPGLIRYSSEEELAGKPRRVLRVRTIAYPALLAIVASLLVWQATARPAAEVWVQRIAGQPFTVLGDGRVSTQAQLRVENRGGATRQYTVELVGAPDLELAAPRAPQAIAAGTQATILVIALAPADAFAGGERAVTLRVRDDAGFVHDVRSTLLGPEERAP
jgi:cytochrome c oxidase accessory protein FixG